MVENTEEKYIQIKYTPENTEDKIINISVDEYNEIKTNPNINTDDNNNLFLHGNNTKGEGFYIKYSTTHLFKYTKFDDRYNVEIDIGNENPILSDTSIQEDKSSETDINDGGLTHTSTKQEINEEVVNNPLEAHTTNSIMTHEDKVNSKTNVLHRSQSAPNLNGGTNTKTVKKRNKNKPKKSLKKYPKK